MAVSLDLQALADLIADAGRRVKESDADYSTEVTAYELVIRGQLPDGRAHSERVPFLSLFQNQEMLGQALDRLDEYFKYQRALAA